MKQMRKLGAIFYLSLCPSNVPSSFEEWDVGSTGIYSEQVPSPLTCTYKGRPACPMKYGEGRQNH